MPVNVLPLTTPPLVTTPPLASSAVAMRAVIGVLVSSCVFALAGAGLCLAASSQGPGFIVAAAAMGAGLAGLGGQILGFRHGPPPRAIRSLLSHVIDNLAQYRAFTRLLRDQGQSITGTTEAAALNIANVLTDMDITLETLAAAVQRDGVGFDRELLVSELRRIRGPIIGILSMLQFQDVTQQQFAFLNRLSLLLDEHMTRLANHLGDRQATDRVAGFKEMFEQALADCVMDSQRDDHHAASGSSAREDPGLMVELF
jgi:hypothetical protein